MILLSHCSMSAICVPNVVDASDIPATDYLIQSLVVLLLDLSDP